MKDFFDEDFPLSEKQEQMLKELEAQKKAEEAEKGPEAIEETHESVSLFDDFEEEVYEIAPEEAPIIQGFDDIEAEISEALTAAVEELYVVEEEPVIIPEEPIEHDPIELSPIIELDSDEPLDDGFLPDCPIIMPEEYEEDELSETLRALGEKLDSMERAVSELTPDEDTPVYEFDERYFAEEETTAYKHPELVKKPMPKKVPKKAGVNVNVDVDLKTLAKVGAAVAGIAIAAKLLSGDKKK